jgi:hypothetical protein
MVLFSIVIIPDSFSLLYSHSLPTIDHSFKVTVPVHAVSHVYVNVNSCQPSSIPIYVQVFETTIILFSGSSKAPEFKSLLSYLIVFLHVIFIVPVQSTLFVSGLISMLQSNVPCVDVFSFTVIICHSTICVFQQIDQVFRLKILVQLLVPSYMKGHT